MHDRQLDPTGEILRLSDGEHLHLRHARGWTVRALAGTVWLVQDGDIRDVVLGPGDSIVVDRNGPVLLSAFDDARLCIARKTVPRAAPALPEAAFA